MAAQTIGLVLRNLPAFSFILALIIAALASSRGSTAERFCPGCCPAGLWARVTRVFFPEVALPVSLHRAAGGCRSGTGRQAANQGRNV